MLLFRYVRKGERAKKVPWSARSASSALQPMVADHIDALLSEPGKIYVERVTLHYSNGSRIQFEKAKVV